MLDADRRLTCRMLGPMPGAASRQIVTELIALHEPTPACCGTPPTTPPWGPEYIAASGAHYHFTVKDNQKTLAQAIRLHLRRRGAPDYIEPTSIGHWRIESLHYLIDWNYDEDRSRIRSGHGPATVTRLRRFANSAGAVPPGRD